MQGLPEIAGSGGIVGLLLVVLILYRKPIIETLSCGGADKTKGIDKIDYSDDMAQMTNEMRRLADALEQLHKDIREELIRRDVFRQYRDGGQN